MYTFFYIVLVSPEQNRLVVFLPSNLWLKSQFQFNITSICSIVTWTHFKTKCLSILHYDFMNSSWGQSSWYHIHTHVVLQCLLFLVLSKAHLVLVLFIFNLLSLNHGFIFSLVPKPETKTNSNLSTIRVIYKYENVERASCLSVHEKTMYNVHLVYTITCIYLWGWIVYLVYSILKIDFLH
jgi:hypothetical protein